MDIAIAHDIGLERVAGTLGIGKHRQQFFTRILHLHPEGFDTADLQEAKVLLDALA